MGFMSGGMSNALVLSPSQTGNNCNTTLPNLDFFFNLDSLLNQSQCITPFFSLLHLLNNLLRQYPLTRFTRATQSIKIFVSFASHPLYLTPHKWAMHGFRCNTGWLICLSSTSLLHLHIYLACKHQIQHSSHLYHGKHSWEAGWEF